MIYAAFLSDIINKFNSFGYLIITSMGSNHSTSSTNDPLKIYKTSFGVLTITLQSLHIYSVDSKGDKNYNEFFMKLIMSNQEAVSKNVVKSGFKNIEAEF